MSNLKILIIILLIDFVISDEILNLEQDPLIGKYNNKLLVPSFN